MTISQAQAISNLNLLAIANNVNGYALSASKLVLAVSKEFYTSCDLSDKTTPAQLRKAIDNSLSFDAKAKGAALAKKIRVFAQRLAIVTIHNVAVDDLEDMLDNMTSYQAVSNKLLTAMKEDEKQITNTQWGKYEKQKLLQKRGGQNKKKTESKEADNSVKDGMTNDKHVQAMQAMKNQHELELKSRLSMEAVNELVNAVIAKHVAKSKQESAQAHYAKGINYLKGEALKAVSVLKEKQEKALKAQEEKASKKSTASKAVKKSGAKVNPLDKALKINKPKHQNNRTK